MNASVRRGGPTGMDFDVAELLVEAAVRAPSVHNTQPWRFVLDRDGGIELWADRSRLLPEADPTGRELVISCGAALAVLMLGVRWLGHQPLVTRQPAPDRPDLLARLTMGPPRPPDGETLDLFVAVADRHTHRGPFDDRPVPPALLDRLRRLARRRGCRADLVDDVPTLLRVARLTAAAEVEQRRRWGVRTERVHWLRTAGSRELDGMPEATTAVPPAGLGRLAPRWFESAAYPPAGHGPAAGHLPTTMVLSTGRDDVTAWLLAGEALHEVLLHAACHSVYASLHTQSLELPGTRARLAAVVGGGHPQMLLQLGYADSVPTAPRRPPRDVLTAR